MFRVRCSRRLNLPKPACSERRAPYLYSEVSDLKLTSDRGEKIRLICNKFSPCERLAVPFGWADRQRRQLARGTSCGAAPDDSPRRESWIKRLTWDKSR